MKKEKSNFKFGLKLPVVFASLNIIVCILILVFASFPEFTESVYTARIYPVLLSVLSPLADLFAFSLQEILALLLFLAAAFYTGILIRRVIKKRLSLKIAAMKLFYRAFIGLSVIFILFYLLWGFNYFRVRLADHAAFDPEKITEAEFTALFSQTIAEVNRLHPHADTDTNTREVHEAIRKNLNALIFSIDGIRMYPPRRVKIFSLGIFELFPYTGLTLPFLYEAHISSNSFSFEIPFLSAHEQTHLFGRALESEANFIAYHACIQSEDPSIQYSGHFALLRYLFASLVSEEIFLRWWDMLSPEVQNHFAMIQERRLTQSGLLRAISKSVYNSFLKTQNIEDGIQNYRGIVQLVLGYTLKER